MSRLLAVAILTFAAAACGTSRAADSRHCPAPPQVATEFATDFCRHLVPLSQFQAGGPGKDGIPAIDRPHFAPVSMTRWLAAASP